MANPDVCWWEHQTGSLDTLPAMRSLKTLLNRNEPADETVAEPRHHEHCLSCNADLEGSRSYERFRVCHSCGFHFHLTARERLANLLDVGRVHEDDRRVP